MQLYLLHVHWKPSSLFLAAAKVCQIMSREFHCFISYCYSKSWVPPLLLPSYVSFFFLSFYSSFVAFLCFDFLLYCLLMLVFSFFLFIRPLSPFYVLIFYCLFLFFYLIFLLPFLFSLFFFTFIFVFVFWFLWASSLAYPNLLGTKRLSFCFVL
jgi:hypothetical protein